MPDLDKLQDDFGFVRASVAGSPLRTAPAVYFLWGTLVLCGFTLSDVRPAWVPLYWTIVGPAGAILSGYLAYSRQRTIGHLDRIRAARHAWHWGAMLSVIFLGGLTVRAGLIAGDAYGTIVLLLLAQAYFHAGIHLDKPLRWIGVLLAVGYIVVLTVAGPAWTMTGVVIGSALALAGVREWRGRAVAA